MIPRKLKSDIDRHKENIPVVAIIGARQVGKTTLAKELISENGDAIFLDLEKYSDRQVITETEGFLKLNKGKIICIDEIQMMPEILYEIRNFVDNYPDTKFILLGSSSPNLLKNTSESLAGRIFYFELTPFLWDEIKGLTDMNNYRLVGGLPKSILAKTPEDSFIWIKTILKLFLKEI